MATSSLAATVVTATEALGSDPDFRARVQYTFEQMDRTSSGSVSFMELLSWWKAEAKIHGEGKIDDATLNAARQGFLDYDLDQSGGLNTLEEVAALLSSLDLLKYVPDELPQNLEPEPTRDMSALWRKAGLVVGLCTRRKMAAAAAGLMTEEDVNLDLEVVNDLENEEDARKVAEENGVSLSGCSGLQAIKDRLASHFGEQRAGAVMKMAVVEHQGMQIDTEDDLAEVLEIVDDLDDPVDALTLCTEEGIDISIHALSDDDDVLLEQLKVALKAHYSGDVWDNWMDASNDLPELPPAEDSLAPPDDGDGLAEMVDALSEEEVLDLCEEEGVPRPFGASMAELRAALRAFYGADDPPSEPSPPPPPPPAAGSGSFQISAAEYLEILDEMDEQELAETIEQEELTDTLTDDDLTEDGLRAVLRSHFESRRAAKHWSRIRPTLRVAEMLATVKKQNAPAAPARTFGKVAIPDYKIMAVTGARRAGIIWKKKALKGRQARPVGPRVPDVFDEIDLDCSGFMTFNEFVRWWKRRDKSTAATSTISDETLMQAMAAFQLHDIDHSGAIERNEFNAFLRALNLDSMLHVQLLHDPDDLVGPGGDAAVFTVDPAEDKRSLEEELRQAGAPPPYSGSDSEDLSDASDAEDDDEYEYRQAVSAVARAEIGQVSKELQSKLVARATKLKRQATAARASTPPPPPPPSNRLLKVFTVGMQRLSASSEKFKRVKLVSKELAQPRAEKMQLGVGAMSLVLLQSGEVVESFPYLTIQSWGSDDTKFWCNFIPQSGEKPVRVAFGLSRLEAAELSTLTLLQTQEMAKLIRPRAAKSKVQAGVTFTDSVFAIKVFTAGKASAVPTSVAIQLHGTGLGDPSRLAEAAATTLQVLVQPGWAPGMVVPVVDPTTGQVMQVQLPADAHPGATLRFNSDGSPYNEAAQRLKAAEQHWTPETPLEKDETGHVLFGRGVVDEWIVKFDGDYGRIQQLRLHAVTPGGKPWLVEKITVQDMRSHAKYSFHQDEAVAVHHRPSRGLQHRCLTLQASPPASSEWLRGPRAQELRQDPVLKRFECVRSAYAHEEIDGGTRVGKLEPGMLFAAVEVQKIDTASLESTTARDFTLRARGLLPPAYVQYCWVSTRSKDEKQLLKPSTTWAQFNETENGCAGWLEKKRSDAGGIVSGRWHRRWFVLRGTLLSKFESNNAGEGTEQTGGAVDLTQVHEVRPSINHKAKEYEIELITTTRIMRLRAINEFEMRSWIDALQRHSYTEGDSPPPDALRAAAADPPPPPAI